MVVNSAHGNAIHTPFMPNTAERRKANARIATNPRDTEAANAQRADSTALRVVVPTILTAAEEEPVI